MVAQSPTPAKRPPAANLPAFGEVLARNISTLVELRKEALSLRPVYDDRLAGGDLSLDLCADQPERMAAAADRRAELDLQINLLAEHEVTQTVRLLDAIAQHLGVARPDDEEIEEAKDDMTRRLSCTRSSP